MATLKVEDLVAIVDTREQDPLDLSPFRTVRGTLQAGDYSLRGLEDHIAIERKSLPDLVACVGRERPRFLRELQRLRAYPVRAVICECTWQELELGQWRSQVSRRSVMGSVLSWTARYCVPFLFAGDHDSAAIVVKGLLWHSARHRYSELQGLLEELRPRARKKEAAIAS